MKPERDDTDITELPSLNGWYERGLELGATHLIVATEFDEPFDPYYVMPDEDWRDKENRIEGGGHVFETYDLSKSITQSQLDRFYKWVR